MSTSAKLVLELCRLKLSVAISTQVETIDVRKGVLGGPTPPLRLKILADPPPWKIFEQVTP